MDIECICFQVIKDASNARCKYIEAVQEAKCNNYVRCDECIREGNEAFRNAYRAHGSLICLEADGKRTQLNLLLLHAQDQLSNAESFKVLCNEFIDVYHNVLRTQEQVQIECI